MAKTQTRASRERMSFKGKAKCEKPERKDSDKTPQEEGLQENKATVRQNKDASDKVTESLETKNLRNTPRITQVM